MCVCFLLSWHRYVDRMKIYIDLYLVFENAFSYATFNSVLKKEDLTYDNY